MEKAMSDSQPASVRSDQSGWMDADAYIFDIDGTLLNTRDLVHWNALHQAMLEVYGVDTTIEGIAYHGKTDIGILGAALERAGLGRRLLRRLGSRRRRGAGGPGALWCGCCGGHALVTGVHGSSSSQSTLI